MRLHDNNDFTTLTWVKPELDETLRQARNALQMYVEEGEDPKQLKDCASFLHQVQGTLRMVELYGAAMVAEEMEQLSKALIEGKVEKRDDAYGVLMQGIVQLPDYLERLQTGHRDIPIVLLPLLNQLRSSRGEQGLSESVLFSPDLSRPLPDSAKGPDEPLPADELSRRADTLRNLFQGALLRWLKDDNSSSNIKDMTDVCDQLVPITFSEPARRLFWVASGTLDALSKGAFQASNALKQSLGKVEREIKRLAEGGDDAFRSDPPIELTRQLLYFVAHEASGAGRIGEIREVFGLNDNVPDAAELAHAQGSLTGHNRALLATVAVAIKEDLMRVKDSLDLHLRTPNAASSDLNSQVDALDRVGDTLGMLGLGVARRVVQEQRTAINDVVSGQRVADEATLLDIAGALLYVEASLDDQVARLGQDDSANDANAVTGIGTSLPSSEARKVLDVLLKEAATNFTQARQCFVAFVETHWDHTQLNDVPRLLDEVAGALRVLDVDKAPDYLTGVRRFTESELLRRQRVPNGQQMDRLADALASLEYFLEAVRDRRPNREQILEVAQHSLEALGYWPLPAQESAEPIAKAAPVSAPAPAPAKPAAVDHLAIALAPFVPVPDAPRVIEEIAPAAFVQTPLIEEPSEPSFVDILKEAVSAPAFDAQVYEAATIPVAVAVSAPVSAAPVSMVPVVGQLLGSFDATSDEIDDEIREVFSEEFEEEIGNLEQLLPPWRSAPSNPELLRPIRRVFHTLKGSGRLVGAKTLGEFSWKVETLLNRVLDGTRAGSPAVVALLDKAFNTLPLLRAALLGETVYADLKGIEAITERLIAGEEVYYQTAPLAAVAANIPVGAGLTDAPVADEVPEAEVQAAPEVASTEPEVEVADGIEFSIDPVLFEILKPEVAGHLETVEHWIAESKRSSNTAVTEVLLRSVHTMNGAFAMTEVTTITDVTAPLEGYLKRAMAHAVNLDANAVALVSEAAAAINQTITALDRPKPVLPRFEDLAARIQSLRDALPESTQPSVPIHMDADAEQHMPSVALIEKPDVSAIPDFSGTAAAAEAAAAEAAAAEAAAAETSAAEAAAAEAAAAEAAAAKAAAAEAAAAKTAAAEAAEAEAAAAETAAAETAAAEAAAAKTAAAEAAETAVAETAAAEAAEAAAAEAAAAAAESAAVETTGSDVEIPQDVPETELVSFDAFLDMEQENNELIGSEIEIIEPVAGVEEVEFVMEDAASVEQVEAALELTPEPAPEFGGADDALAAMIAAYGEQPSIEAQAAFAEEDADSVDSAKTTELEAPEEAPSEQTQSESDSGLVVPAQSEDSAVTEAALADEDYYGMSLDELDALTAPGDVAPMPAAMAEDEIFAAITTEQGLVEVPAAEEEVFSEEEAVAGEEALAEEALPEEALAEEALAEEALAEEAVVEEEIYFADEPEEAVVAVAPMEQTAEPIASRGRAAVPLAIDPSDPDEPLDMSDLDPELLDIFLEESGDILDHSDGVLAKLRNNQSDMDLIVDLQRDLHTLKGGARMTGIFPVGELGHTMESLLEAVAEGRIPLNNTGVVVLERGFDRLHSMVTRVGERKALAMPSNLIAQFEALALGQTLEVVADFETSAPQDVDQAISEKTTGFQATAAKTPVEKATPVALKPLSAPTDAFNDDDDGSGVRAPQEQVRIRADLLDKLVNYAGEVAIYRARLEQQLGAFRGALGELGQTTTRLREQLRRLEIETEAQIVARYQREGEETGETFDPLELDRFTTQQQLSRSLSESANDLINLETTLDDLTRQYETLLLQQARVSSDLQEGLMRTRMVPFDALVPRLRRVLRQAASDTGKQVQLKVDGASGEMDRNVLERMTAPLEHMLRNSMAHGLELPADRRKAKKSEEGTVRIVVQREGSEVVLKIIDDGRGLNKEAIRNKAIERGLLVADTEISDSALYAMILETGFSTAETVSRLSGRGVGMDVVYSEIRQLGGTLQINSDEGKGSEFIIRLPFTLAVTQAVFVKIGDTSFAVPIASVQGVGRIGRSDLETQLATDAPVFAYAGEDYAIHDLGRLIGHGSAKAVDSLQMPLLLARSGDLRAAICVDQVMGSREIVVKPVGPQVNSIPGIFGATIMGDGRVVMILDVAPLVRRYNLVRREDAPLIAVAAPEIKRIPVVMVVDDSITMRKVTGRVLERNNFEVLTAKDGVDAVEKMAERAPDLVLLDIEMPRMDGYEVAQHMRSDPRLKDVPIIMITSRTGDKHRQRAMDLGVDRYLGKPYQENELMRNVFEILGMEPVNG